MNAIWLVVAMLATSERSNGLKRVGESGENAMFDPPSASMRVGYSPAGSNTMIWSSGCASTVLVISRLTLNDLPEPGLPQTNPIGDAKSFLLQTTRLPDCFDCP